MSFRLFKFNLIWFFFFFWLLIVCLWRYEEDVWTEIAKFLDGRSLMKLAVTSKWFQRVIMDDSIWKFVCLRDLQLPAAPQHVDFKWFDLYTSAFGMYKNFTLSWTLYSACFPRLYHQLFLILQMGATLSSSTKKRSILVSLIHRAYWIWKKFIYLTFKIILAEYYYYYYFLQQLTWQIVIGATSLSFSHTTTLIINLCCMSCVCLDFFFFFFHFKLCLFYKE